MTGAADTELVLSRVKRGDREAVLHITGRDVEARDLALRFDSEQCRWISEGRPDARQKRQLMENPLFAGALYLAKKERPWKGTASDLIRDLSQGGFPLRSDNPKTVSSVLRKLETELWTYGKVRLTRRPRGTGGAIYTLEYRGEQTEPAVAETSGTASWHRASLCRENG